MQQIGIKKLLSMPLENIYLDWVNNFTTIGRMAEYYETDPDTLIPILESGRKLYKIAYP